MAFDGVTVNAVKQELTTQFIDARIDRIYQPHKDELVFHLRSQRENYKLVISAHPVYSRIHITKKTYMYPKTPPLFCMVLRKHLEGGRILSIEQNGLERVLTISIESRTELGDMAEKVLIVEIMGKHSNIILLDPKTKAIIDSAKRVSSSMSQFRQILPGLQYMTPPAQEKLNLLSAAQEEFNAAMLSQNEKQPTAKAIVAVLEGISPSMALQLCHKADIQDTHIEFLGNYEYNRLWQALLFLRNRILSNSFTPVIFIDSAGHYKGFSPICIPEFLPCLSMEQNTISEIVDQYYTYQIEHQQFLSTQGNLKNQIDKEIKRCQKKMAIQLDYIGDSERAMEDQLFGELLTANLYRIQRGMTEITVENYYDEGKPVTIKLREALSPAENAQRYFKKYSKAKKTFTKASQQAKSIKEELQYLESLLYWLSEISSAEEFVQIEQELIENDYLKEKNKTFAKEKQEKQPPLTVNLGDGFTALVGKNNKQNDWVTFKAAQPDDLWLHVKDLPGSHVIVKASGRKIPDALVETAALLAAHYSKGRHSSNLPVDYTFVKHVKKIKGAKPGNVIYDRYQTIFVTPTTKVVEDLLN